MVCCAVADCSNNNTAHKDLDLHFHRFPRDTELRVKWIQACKRADKFSADKARVCSVHFDKSDYLRDLKGELLNLLLKHELKPDAVPHLFLPRSGLPVVKYRPEKAEHYGTFTNEISLPENNWLQALSRGRLMKPSKECLDSVMKMEKELFHGEYINRCPGVFSKLIEKIEGKFPSIDNFVISCYVGTRTFMLMKSLNLKKSEQKRLAKKRTVSEQRQKRQKMAKLLN